MTTKSLPTLTKTQESGLVVGIYAALFLVNAAVALIALS